MPPCQSVVLFHLIASLRVETIPVAACTLWVRNVEAEHEAHQHHLKEENGGKLPETPAYEYLNRRGMSSCASQLVAPSVTRLDSVGSLPLGHEHSILQPQGLCALLLKRQYRTHPTTGQQGSGSC